MYSSPIMIQVIKQRRMRMDGACGTYRERSAYRVLVEIPEGKGPLV
jgi:hypothetical protein